MINKAVKFIVDGLISFIARVITSLILGFMVAIPVEVLLYLLNSHTGYWHLSLVMSTVVFLGDLAVQIFLNSYFERVIVEQQRNSSYLSEIYAKLDDIEDKIKQNTNNKDEN